MRRYRLLFGPPVSDSPSSHSGTISARSVNSYEASPPKRALPEESIDDATPSTDEVQQQVEKIKQRQPCLENQIKFQAAGLPKGLGEIIQSVAELTKTAIRCRFINPGTARFVALAPTGVVGKPIGVKCKSSDMPFLMGLIPADSRFAKTSTDRKSNEEAIHAAIAQNSYARSAPLILPFDFITSFSKIPLRKTQEGYEALVNRECESIRFIFHRCLKEAKLPDYTETFNCSEGDSLYQVYYQMSDQPDQENPIEILVDKTGKKLFVADLDFVLCAPLKENRSSVLDRTMEDHRETLDELDTAQNHSKGILTKRISSLLDLINQVFGICLCLHGDENHVRGLFPYTKEDNILFFPAPDEEEVKIYLNPDRLIMLHCCNFYYVIPSATPSEASLLERSNSPRT